MVDILQYAFFQHALLAGSLVAIIAAVVGYFLVVRGLTFAGHALAHIGFAGAAGAVLLGINPIWGLLVFTLGTGTGIGLLGKEIRSRDLAIGILMTFALGLGMLFLSLYHGFAEQAYSILFGDILGVSATNVLITAIFALCVLLILLVLFRPLLFSSFDQDVAEARGVPVQALSIGFLLLVAVTVSMSVQVIGVLLIFTLLIGPAATAMRIVSHPIQAIALAMILGISYVWLGMFLAAYTFNGTLPPSFFISTISFIVYMFVRLLSPRWSRSRRSVQEMPAIDVHTCIDEHAHAKEVVQSARGAE